MLGSHTTPAPLLVGKVTRKIGNTTIPYWLFEDNGHETLVPLTSAKSADDAFDLLQTRTIH